MHEKSIELLNKAVADELTAVHQYMFFHFHCEDQGYGLISNLFLRTAVEEMRHIELCAERILFLKGEVELVAAGSVEKIRDVKAMLNKAREMEKSGARDYNLLANECSANAGSGSKKVFESLVADEERHYNQFDMESDKIEKFGERYLALQAAESSREAASGPGGAA